MANSRNIYITLERQLRVGLCLVDLTQPLMPLGMYLDAPAFNSTENMSLLQAAYPKEARHTNRPLQ